MPCDLAMCNICYKKIESLGKPCVDATILACDAHVNGSCASYDVKSNSKLIQIIDFLEMKKFLITTEVSPDEIAFKPTCEPKLSDGGLKTYCWCADGE